MGFYATLHPERVAHLVVLNTLYGGTDGHPLLGRGSDLEDEDNPGRLSKSLGAYRWSTASSLLSSWDRSIPLENKSEWRDPAVAEAYVAAALDSDPEGRQREPRAFRAPSGAMGRYLGVYHLAFAGAFMLAPLTGTALYEAVGPRGLWSACFVLGLLLPIAYVLLHRRTGGWAVPPRDDQGLRGGSL